MTDEKTPSIDDKNTETEEEDMEQETPESDQKSTEDSGSGSDDEGSSELDEEECERRRNECLDDMAELERQFSDIKEHLFHERDHQVDAKFEEVRSGNAQEYLMPLTQLQENMRIRIQVAGILRELQMQCIKTRFDSEQIGAYQNMESEKIILYDSLKDDLVEKIRRLEEDRNTIDISSDLWNESLNSKKNKKKTDPLNPNRRRKPVTVTGPYIVYLLREIEIIEDWTAIRKALKQQKVKRKESSYF